MTSDDFDAIQRTQDPIFIDFFVCVHVFMHATINACGFAGMDVWSMPVLHWRLGGETTSL